MFLFAHVCPCACVCISVSCHIMFVMSCHVTCFMSQHTMSHHVCHVMPCHIMSHVTLMSCHVTSCLMSHHDCHISCHIMSHHVTPCLSCHMGMDHVVCMEFAFDVHGIWCVEFLGMTSTKFLILCRSVVQSFQQFQNSVLQDGSGRVQWHSTPLSMWQCSWS